MKNIFVILALLLAPCALLQAAAVKLTRAQASELYVALVTAEAGFAPANSIAAADNLNTLRPVVEALDKGKLSAQRAARRLAKEQPADIEERTEALMAELEAQADVELTLDLTPLALTDEELTAAKLKPAQLATIRRWLKPAAKP